MYSIGPGIKNLLLLNVAIFVLQNLATSFSSVAVGGIEKNFALYFFSVLYEYKFWQIFTYMFLHGGFFHLLFNMLALFFIGSELERSWGTKNFLLYYLFTGLGAGGFIFAVDYLKFVFNPTTLNFGYTLGASGAIFGLVLAYSLLFAERQITLLLFFFLPVTIKAKNLLPLSLALTIIPDLVSSSISISHSGHLGGVGSGFVFLLLFRKRPAFSATSQRLRNWFFSLRHRKSRQTQQQYWRGEYHRIDETKNTVKNSLFGRRRSEALDEREMSEREIEEKIDQLLEVISEEGLGGLSAEEKAFLSRISIRYRHKFPY